MNIAVSSEDWQFHMNEQRELMCIVVQKMRHTGTSPLGRCDNGMRVDTSEVMP
jgi:hypothetical protein